MNFLRLFRAPELAFWSLVVALLAGLVLLSAHLGGHTAPTAGPGVPVVRSATTSSASAQVGDLLALMPAGTSAGTDAGALRAWATQVAQTAEAGASTRSAEGAPAGDDLLAEFSTVNQLAQSLSASAQSPVAATALRTQVGMHVSRLEALISGSPAPALPAGATDMFSGSRTPATQPTAAAPGVPAAPAGNLPTTKHTQN